MQKDCIIVEYIDGHLLEQQSWDQALKIFFCSKVSTDSAGDHYKTEMRLGLVWKISILQNTGLLPTFQPAVIGKLVRSSGIVMIATVSELPDRLLIVGCWIISNCLRSLLPILRFLCFLLRFWWGKKKKNFFYTDQVQDKFPYCSQNVHTAAAFSCYSKPC